MRRLLLPATLLLASCAELPDGGAGSATLSYGSSVTPPNPLDSCDVLPDVADLGFLDEPRTIDGSDNHLWVDDLGQAGTPLRRLGPSAYPDGQGALAGPDRPSARLISNLVAADPGDRPAPFDASDFVWQLGQFVDHDIDLSPGGTGAAPIPVPPGDPWFDPWGSGAATIDLTRSGFAPWSGTTPGNGRQQLNAITAWIDASQVYGSDEGRALALRTLDGTGRLLTSAGDMPPWNDGGWPNAGGDGPELFLAGDERANEQVGLTALHTVFVREHNRLADQIGVRWPQLDGEDIYEFARALVGAQMQAITYREFLPKLLGAWALPPRWQYDSTYDASIANEFSTAAYRFGHSMLSPQLLRLQADGSSAGALPLADAFFRPDVAAADLEALLRGLASQHAQAVDPYVVDGVRNFLFGPPGSGGFDLASLNIQRGRDHGLPSYNQMRTYLYMPEAAGWSDFSSDPQIQARLAAAYDSPDDVDLWVGGLAEDPIPGSLVGETVFIIVSDQFLALRDGDRLWYEDTLPPELVQCVNDSTLARIVRRNTDIELELPDDVFTVAN